MRIRTFCKFIENQELDDYVLSNGCNVVIDAQNISLRAYEKSGLPFRFGCESDKFATYFRNHLKMFKDANVKCYFIFKGGHKDINKKLNKKKEEELSPRVNPIFVKEICKEVLNELEIQYTVSEFESKADVIALARKLNCPVISFDIEYCFAVNSYIPESKNFDFINRGGEIHVRIFKLEKFLEKHKLTKEKLAIFITLTDEYIFGEKYFLPLFNRLGFRQSYYVRNCSLLKWLGSITVPGALNIIYKHVDKKIFSTEMIKCLQFLNTKIPEGISENYLSDRENIKITHCDPEWFKKGVALGHIAVQYIDLYHSNTFFGSWVIEKDNVDSLFFSIEIIKYAFNLLTNYTKSEFIFYDKNGKTIKISALTQPADGPKYADALCPFVNGWESVGSFQLFEQFLEKNLQRFSTQHLQTIPESARLVVISLVYFSQKQNIETVNIICSVILSYVMLEIAFDKCFDDYVYPSDATTQKKPYLDPMTDERLVTELDCTVAKIILKSYFEVTDKETMDIFDQNLIHPLVEFQHCLVQLNNLNKLCGMTFTPTKFSKTYHGTFVYKLVHAMENNNEKGKRFINQILNPAPTVLSFFNGMYGAYEALMYP